MPPEPPIVPLGSELKALFIMARFSEETNTSCTPDPWPETQPGEPVPGWAHDLFEDGVPVEGSGSITEFFYVMSNGHHLVRGSTYPKVIVLEEGVPHYRALGRQFATNAVIDSVDADPTFDFSQFDLNEDETVDFVFVCYRQVYSETAALFDGGETGVAYLYLPPTTKFVDSGTLKIGNGAELYPKTARRGPEQTRGLALHEYGHHVVWLANAVAGFPINNHLRTVGHYGLMDGIDIDVGSGVVLETLLRLRLGWLPGVRNVTLHELQTAGEQTITLTDVAATGAAGCAIVQTPDPKQYFVLECRDSTASKFTDGTVLGGATACQRSAKGSSGLVIWHVSEHEDETCCPPPGAEAPSVVGWWLNDDALAPECDPDPLCEHACFEEECCTNESYPPFLDVEVAAGMLETDAWSPDAETGFDRMSCQSCEGEFFEPSSSADLFGNGQSNLFAPFTNPSTNLYWFAESQSEYDRPANCNLRRQQIVPSGLTFYNIGWSTPPGGGDGVMQLQVRYDPPPPSGQPYSTPPGMEWAGQVQLIADVHVPAGGTLSVTGGTRVIVASNQDAAQAGADAEAVELTVAGTLDLQDASSDAIEFTSSRDASFLHYLGSGENGESADGGDWHGIKVGAAGNLVIGTEVPAGAVDIRYAREALAFSASQFPANLEKIDFVSNTFDVTFDRDVTVPVGVDQVIPAGWDIGFAPVDLENAPDGKDGARIELIVKGAVEFAGTAPAPVTFTSTSGAPAAGAWYGVRTTNLATQILGQYVILKHALGALALEQTPGALPDFATLTSRGFAFEDNANDVSVDRDVVLASGTSTTIPAGWRVGFGPGDAVNQGNDATRVEVIVQGTLEFAGTAGARPILSSASATPASGDWYGARTTNLAGQILGQHVLFKHAASALALEQSPGALPDFANLTSRGFAFVDNVSDVSVDRDVVLASETSTTIPAGWRVGFGPGDAENQGRVSGLAELIVRGVLEVQGAPSNQVTLNSPIGAQGGWAGLLIDQLATVSSGYGYAVGSIAHAEIQDATAGIAIRQTGAPTLTGLTFLNITGDRHIVLDSSDVYVPYDNPPFVGGWNLGAATRVKVAPVTRTGAEIGPSGGRNPGKVDLIVHGRLVASGSSGSRVTFEPYGTPGTGGDDWGGVLLDWATEYCVLDHVEISHALTPLSLLYQDAIVSNSFLHHFRDRGMWVKGGGIDGPSVLNTRVDRWPDGMPPLGGAVGNEGIVVEDCAFGLFEADTVRLVGAQGTAGGFGLQVRSTGGKFGFCTQTTASPETLMVRACVLEGPGGDPSEVQSPWSGIRGDWACGAGIRKVHIEENVIDGWNEAGFNFDQSKDIQVTCNTVLNCAKALEFTRNTDILGPAVKFRTNVLRIGAYGGDNDQPVFRTDNGQMLKLGPTVDKGKNQLIADGFDLYGYENDPSSNPLNAEQNLWQRGGGAPHEAVGEILDHISTETAASVLVSVASPQSEIPDLCSPSSAQPASERERVEAGDPTGPMLVDGAATLPQATELTVQGPLVGRAEIRFSLAGGESRRVEVDLFDVAGRRVKRLVSDDLPGGRYGISWDGVSDQGNRAAAGVYLVRMRAGEVREVRKLVLLR